ncbi:rhombosortase [Variovorax sp. W2I14]|uniref:rhombosortase n=1 Tax=Variovorax sp. W2I14 TaxID=3042290 RepID=UPI003D1BA010
MQPLPLRSFANWLVPVALACLVLALQAGGEPVYEALRYERAAVLGGQYWRLLSAHAVHLGWAHCLMNAGGLALCAALAAGTRNWCAWATAIVVLAIGVGILLVAASPEATNYAGLSGVLYGLFIWVLAPRAWRGDRVAWIVLVAVIARIGWQMFHPPSDAQRALIGGEVMVEAHLYGALCALALCLWQGAWPRLRRARDGAEA